MTLAIFYYYYFKYFIPGKFKQIRLSPDEKYNKKYCVKIPLLC